MPKQWKWITRQCGKKEVKTRDLVTHPAQVTILAIPFDHYLSLSPRAEQERLIEAAPELLAVCERVHGLLLADQDVLTEEDWRVVGKQLYAAIAKATGATP